MIRQKGHDKETVGRLNWSQPFPDSRSDLISSGTRIVMQLLVAVEKKGQRSWVLSKEDTIQ